MNNVNMPAETAPKQTEDLISDEISNDVIDWIDITAECCNMTPTEVAEKFLIYGAVHYEQVLLD